MFEARVRFNTIVTTGAINLGLVDAGTYTASPWTLSGTTLADHANVADGVAFLYDTDATTVTIRLVSTKAGTVGTLAAGTMVDTGIAPTVDVFHLYTIRCDTSGNANFYIDDIYRGSIPAAFTTTTALEPFVGVGNRDNSTNEAIAIDYILTSGKRLA